MPFEERFTPTVLNIKAIKDIVQQGLKEKQQLSVNNGPNNNFFSELAIRRKLGTPKKSEKDAAVLGNLDQYIDFEDIFFYISQKIKARYWQLKKPWERGKVNGETKLNRKMHIVKEFNIKHRSSDKNEHIQHEFGEKYRSVLQIYASQIDNFTSSLSKNQNFKANEFNINHFCQSLKRQQKHQKRSYRNSMELPYTNNQQFNLNKNDLPEVGLKSQRQHDLAKVCMTNRSKQQLQQCLRIGLAFLVIAIQREKKNSTKTITHQGIVKGLTHVRYQSSIEAGIIKKKSSFSKKGSKNVPDLRQKSQPDLGSLRLSQAQFNKISALKELASTRLKQTQKEQQSRDQGFSNLKENQDILPKPFENQQFIKTDFLCLKKCKSSIRTTNKSKQIAQKFLISSNVSQKANKCCTFKILQNKQSKALRQTGMTKKIDKQNQSHKKQKKRMLRILKVIQNEQIKNKIQRPLLNNFLAETAQQFKMYDRKQKDTFSYLNQDLYHEPFFRSQKHKQ